MTQGDHGPRVSLPKERTSFWERTDKGPPDEKVVWEQSGSPRHWQRRPVCEAVVPGLKNPREQGNYGGEVEKETG